MIRRATSEENPDMLDGLTSEPSDDTEEVVELSDEELAREFGKQLASAALRKNDSWGEAREDLREAMQAMGLVDDPEALGCNLGDNFCDGSAKHIKKSVKQ